jgi:hypothetical protein
MTGGGSVKCIFGDTLFKKPKSISRDMWKYRKIWMPLFVVGMSVYQIQSALTYLIPMII